MTDADLNREIAEAIGFRLKSDPEDPIHGSIWCHPDCRCTSNAQDDKCTCLDACYWGEDGNPPNFLADETVNAQLRDLMPPMLIAKCRLRYPEDTYQWDICVGDRHELDPDYKRAMCLSFLAWSRTDEGKRALAERRK